MPKFGPPAVKKEKLALEDDQPPKDMESLLQDICDVQQQLRENDISQIRKMVNATKENLEMHKKTVDNLRSNLMDMDD